ncbi:MAG TPA: transglycosylase domain-containing protein, partial [Xanthobacteraceae bacterium]|nr:transglycosylase domain-containing protein [Xanthobacteraceae bacterium]
MRRLVRNLIILAFAVLLIPYVIAPLYRFVDPVSTPMLWRWVTGKRVVRIVVPLNRLAPALRLSVIIAEDGTFCRNRGIDLGAIREAMQQSDELGEARGASTI